MFAGDFVWSNFSNTPWTRQKKEEKEKTKFSFSHNQLSWYTQSLGTALYTVHKPSLYFTVERKQKAAQKNNNNGNERNSLFCNRWNIYVYKKEKHKQRKKTFILPNVLSYRILYRLFGTCFSYAIFGLFNNSRLFLTYFILVKCLRGTIFDLGTSM